MRRSKHSKIHFNHQHAIALAILSSSLAVYLWLKTQGNVSLLQPEGLKQAINGYGIVGILVYISVIALAVIMSPIPGAPLTVAAGAVWGAFWAALYSVIGGFIGGLIAYFIGRSLGRSVVYLLTGKVIYLSTQRGELYLGWLIFITRLLPILSFDLISYGAGISGISLSIYASATLLGMIPSTFFLTFMGAAFQLKAWQGVLLLIIFFILLLGIPWGIHRYNWLGLKDIIQVSPNSENSNK